MPALFEQQFYLPENCEFTKFVTLHLALYLLKK